MSAPEMREKGLPAESNNVKRPSGLSRVGGSDVAEEVAVDFTAGSQALHRKLLANEVQMFAIGGAIGTCKFIMNSLAPLADKIPSQSLICTNGSALPKGVRRVSSLPSSYGVVSVSPSRLIGT